MVAIAQTTTNLMRQVDRDRMEHWVDSVFDSMSYDERIGQLFMIIANPTTDNRNIQRLTKYVNEIKIGGILFHKGNPESQADVTNRMQKLSKVPLWISLDGEWGLSMRLSGTTRFPKNMMLGAIEDNSLIEAYGREVARQCKEMGIHINFAPDIDVNSNEDNPVIGLRSFGESAGAVSDKGLAYARGLEGEGIISVAKHFPGHGDTDKDSHKTLPVVNRSLIELQSTELVPFRSYIRAGLSGVMVGHLNVPALKTGDRPTSQCEQVATKLLKDDMGFKGLVFTDALQMRGAHMDGKTNGMPAMMAGADVLLEPYKVGESYEAMVAAYKKGGKVKERIDESCKKILRYKYAAGLDAYEPVNIEGLGGRINSAAAEVVNRRLFAAAFRRLAACIPT